MRAFVKLYREKVAPPFGCVTVSVTGSSTCSLSMASGGSSNSRSNSSGRSCQVSTDTVFAKGEAATVFQEAFPFPQGYGAPSVGSRKSSFDTIGMDLLQPDESAVAAIGARHSYDNSALRCRGYFLRSKFSPLYGVLHSLTYSSCSAIRVENRVVL